MVGVFLYRRGAVLPLVLGIIFAISLLLSVLLQLPGGVRRRAVMAAEELQQIYDGESALLAHLEGLPTGYFGQPPWNVTLPLVERGRLGPWADFSVPVGAKRLHVLAGIRCDSGCSLLRNYGIRRDIFEGVRSQLKGDMERVPWVVKSGNRRLFGKAESTAFRVVDGDLSLNLEGKASSARFMADGSVELRGSAVFDTLRIFAKGPLQLRGQTRARWLEAFSEDRVDISRGVMFSGIVLARHEAVLESGGKVLRYPSFVMALESSETPAPDSLLLPDFVTGPWSPFEWSMRR